MKIRIEEIIKKSNIVEDSFPNHTPTYSEYYRNTIGRRLKGIALWDPQNRDIDHPANRKKEDA